MRYVLGVFLLAAVVATFPWWALKVAGIMFGIGVVLLAVGWRMKPGEGEQPQEVVHGRRTALAFIVDGDVLECGCGSMSTEGADHAPDCPIAEAGVV